MTEESSRLGKLMSATISRHGDDFLVSLSFQREGVKTKREIRSEKFVPKHPRKPGAETDLRLPHLVNPKRRVLGPVKTVDELIAAATPDDVCGGDRGQRFLITLSCPVTIVRGAFDHPVFPKAVPVTSTPIPAPPPKPEKLAEPEKPGKKPKKQKKVRRRKAKRTRCVMKGGETARKALSGLSDEERHWFMVGEAIAEPSFGTTRGEIGSTSSRRTRSGSREEVGMTDGT